MGLNPERSSLTREPNDAQGRPICFGLPSFHVDREPDLVRALRRHPMEAQGGQQADNAAWYPLGRLRQGVVLSDSGARWNVESAAHSLQGPGLGKPLNA